MAKKKGGKKKGGKKKGGAKKKSSSEPKLTAGERFVQFSVQTRTDQLKIWLARRDELKENSAQLRRDLDEAQRTCNRVVHDLKHQVDNGENEVKGKQNELSKDLQMATANKHDYVMQEQREIKELKAKLRATHDKAVEAAEELKALVVFRRTGQYEGEKQTGLMRQAVQDVLDDFEAAKTELHERFTKSKQKFSDNLDAQLAATKDGATAAAISTQGPEDMSLYEDHEWLRREIDTHVDEAERLEDECARLEEENMLMMRSMYKGDDLGDERWGSIEEYRRRAAGEQDEEGEGEGEGGGRGGGRRRRSGAEVKRERRRKVDMGKVATVALAAAALPDTVA